jgi:hypothetical protein
VRLQLEEALRAVISSDFPAAWPGLLPVLQRHLSGGDPAGVAGALRVLRVLTRKFEFKDEDERGPLAAVVEATFPLVLPIFQVPVPARPRVFSLLFFFCMRRSTTCPRPAPHALCGRGRRRVPGSPPRRHQRRQ